MIFFLLIIVLFTATHSALAADSITVFNLNSITTKPVRADYSSDVAFAADSLVYGVPRTCIWWTERGDIKEAGHGRISSFYLGDNLRKSSNTNWFANSVKPVKSSYQFLDFIYVNSNNGAIAYGQPHLVRLGGSWPHGGK